MSPKQNMLEIFREAGETSTRVGSAGPFGGGEIPSGGLPASGGGGGPRAMVFLGSLAVAFVLGLAVGRQMPAGSEAAASEREPAGESRDWMNEHETPAQQSEVTGESPQGGLYDPANKYTVVVVTYSNTPNFAKYAFNTVDHLAQQGFEVFEPYQRGQELVVLAGAAPSSLRLKSLQAGIQNLDGWNGKSGAFRDAYIEQIDKLVDR